MSESETSTTAMNGDKLSGQLIIKVQLGDDIRKIMIHNEDLTLNELVLMMERIFSGKISNSDELTIKYLDDDGDKITLLNDGDLTVALHFHKFLRLFVFVNGNEQINNLKQDENLVDAKLFRNELQDIRKSVETILDRLQISTKEISTTIPSNTTHESDPYKHSNQQQRAATPDNNRSNSNNLANNEHSTNTVEIQQTPLTDTNQPPPNQFQQMPTPHFVPPTYNHEQQAKTNVFGPPPTTFPGMQSVPNAIAPRFPPATTPPNSSVQPMFNSTSSAPPSTFLGQHASPPQQGGFYAQQQATAPPQQSSFYGQQQGISGANFNPNTTFVPQQTATSNSSPATINPSFVQSPPPPMASQQPYGAYSPQNSYYNPIQPYPKSS